MTQGPEDVEATTRRSGLTPPPGSSSTPPPDTVSRGALQRPPRDRGTEGAAAPPESSPAERPPAQRSPAQRSPVDRARSRVRSWSARLPRPTWRSTPSGPADAGPADLRPATLGEGPASGSRSVRRKVETRTITLPRVQIPPALTETGARILVLTGSRIRPLADSTRPIWHPVVDVLRWVAPLGWTVVGVGLLSWWLTARYAWAELAMAAMACLVLVACCLLLAIGRARLVIRCDVEPTRVTVGDPATGRLEVTNTSVRPLLPVLLELPVGQTAARFTLPALASGRTHEELFVVPTRHRGVVPVGPATTVHGDPLGLVRRTVAWTERTELFVHPFTVALESLGAGLLRDLEGQVTPDLSMSDLAFHALREYQPGDDRRYIHWRSSAKHDRLLVRQFLDTRRSHLALVVDTTPEVYAGGEDAVEIGISCAASLAVRSILDEQDTTVVCNGEQASRTTAPLTLDSLSRAEVGPLDVFRSTGVAATLAPDASVAVLVTGTRRPFIQAQRALAQFEPEVVKVALVVDDSVPVGVRRVGSLVVLHVRELTDLRRVLLSGALT